MHQTRNKTAVDVSVYCMHHIIFMFVWRDRGTGGPNTCSEPLILGAKPPRRLPCPLKPGAIMEMGAAEAALEATESDEADFIVLMGRP